jgi:hypothetical protein
MRDCAGFGPAEEEECWAHAMVAMLDSHILLFIENSFFFRENEENLVSS